MMPVYQIIKEHRVTEKTNQLASQLNKYVFEVNPMANKIEVKYAVQKLLSVAVEKVNILRQKGKRKRSRTKNRKVGTTPLIQKAIVTLKPGYKINLA